MNQLQEFGLISACDALIERQQFNEALALLEQIEGVVATWLKGKVHMSVAKSIAANYMFKEYATLEMKAQYVDVLNKAYDHLFNTAMGLSEASKDFREYLNHCLWKQLGQTENELARARNLLAPVEDENANEQDKNWSPDPDSLIDYFDSFKM